MITNIYKISRHIDNQFKLKKMNEITHLTFLTNVIQQ